MKKVFLTGLLCLFSIQCFAEEIGSAVQSITIENPTFEGFPFETNSGNAICILKGYPITQELESNMERTDGVHWRVVSTDKTRLHKTETWAFGAGTLTKVRCLKH